MQDGVREFPLHLLPHRFFLLHVSPQLLLARTSHREDASVLQNRIAMYVLFTDETNCEPSKQVKFFITGGLEQKKRGQI